MTGQEGEQLGVMTAPEGEGPRNNQGSGRQSRNVVYGFTNAQKSSISHEKFHAKSKIPASEEKA